MDSSVARVQHTMGVCPRKKESGRRCTIASTGNGTLNWKIYPKILSTFRSKWELEKTLENRPYRHLGEENLKRIINPTEESEGGNSHNHYTIHNHLLFIRKTVYTTNWRLVISGVIAQKLIQDFRKCYGHTRQKKTMEIIKETFYIRKLEQQINHVVGRCDLYQKIKVGGRGHLCSVHSEQRRSQRRYSKLRSVVVAQIQQKILAIIIKINKIVVKVTHHSNFSIISFSTVRYIKFKLSLNEYNIFH